MAAICPFCIPCTAMSASCAMTASTRRRPKTSQALAWMNISSLCSNGYSVSVCSKGVSARMLSPVELVQRRVVRGQVRRHVKQRPTRLAPPPSPAPRHGDPQRVLARDNPWPSQMRPPPARRQRECSRNGKVQPRVSSSAWRSWSEAPGLKVRSYARKEEMMSSSVTVPFTSLWGHSSSPEYTTARGRHVCMGALRRSVVPHIELRSAPCTARTLQRYAASAGIAAGQNP